MSNLDNFMVVYEKHMRAVHSERPEEYLYPASEIPIVLGKMRAAIERGSMNKNSLSFTRTCKELGIKHTYAAIKDYILT
jgi:hypothetical protein